MNMFELSKFKYCTLFLLFFLFASKLTRAQNCSVNAGNSFTICPGKLPVTVSGNVSATNVNPSSILWSLGSRPAGATVDIASPQSLTTDITGVLPSGDYVLYLGVTCEDSLTIQDSIILTVAPLPTEAVITAPSNFGCYDGTGIGISGNGGLAGEASFWRVVSGVPGYFDNANSANTIFYPESDYDDCKIGADGYVTRLEYRIVNGSCLSSDYADIGFTNSKDTFSVTSTNILTCGFCTELTGSCNLDGLGNWSVSGPGNVVFTGGSDRNKTEVCVDEAGWYNFTWTVTGGCRSGQDSTRVYFQEFGIEGFLPEAGEDHLYCKIPPSISLTATPLGDGQLGRWFQIKGLPAAIDSPTNPSTQIDSLEEGGGPFWFLWAVTGLDCVLFDTVKILERPTWGFESLYDLGCQTSFDPLEDEILLTTPISFDVLDDFEVTLTFLEVPQGYENNITFYPQAVGTSPGNLASAKFSLDVFLDGTTKDTAQVGIPFTYTIPASLVKSQASSSVLAHEDFSFSVVFDKYQPRGNYKYNVTVANACGTSAFNRDYDVCGFSVLTPKAGTDVRLDCGITNTSLAGTGMFFPNITDPIKIHSGIWYTVETPGADPLNDSNRYDTNPSLVNLEEGQYVFRYVSLFGNECSMKYDDINVYVSSSAPSGINTYLNQPAVCGTGVAQLIADSGTSTEAGTWIQVSPPVTTEQMVLSNTQDTVNLINLQPNTNYVFEYVNSNNCGEGRDTVSFITDGFQGPSLANVLEEYACIGTGNSYDIMADTVIYGQGNWTLLSAPTGASPTISPADSNSTTVAGMTEDGPYLFEFSITNPPCVIPSKDYIKVVRGDAPLLSAGTDIYDCQLSFPTTVILDADSSITGTAAWVFISGPSIPSITNPSSPTTAVAFSMPGTYQLEWVNKFGPCSKAADPIRIVLGEVSTIANAGPDQSTCNNSSVFTLDAVDPPFGETGLWTVASTSGNMVVTFTDQADPNTTVTLSSSGWANLRFTTFARTASCANTNDEVTIKWLAPAYAGEDMNLCNGESVELQGNDPFGLDSVTVGWTFVSGPSTPNFETADKVHTVVNGLVEGSYVFNYSVNNSTCNSSDNVQVNIVAAEIAVASADQAVCTGDLIPLGGNTPMTAASHWYLMDGEDVGSFSNSTADSTSYGPVNGADDYIFAYSLDNGTCVTYDYTRVYVLESNDIVNTTTATTCNNNEGIISLELLDIPVDLLDFAWSNGATTQNISGLEAGIYEVTVSSSNGCVSTVAVALNNSNGPLVDFGANQLSCPSEAIVLNPVISGGVAPYTYLWETGETNSNVAVSPSNTTTYRLTVTDNAGCQNEQFAAIDIFPLALVDLGTDILDCRGQVTLSPQVTAPAGFTDRGAFSFVDFSTGLEGWVQDTSGTDEIDWNMTGTYAIAGGTAAMDQVANLQSPIFDLSHRNNVQLSFDYAFAGNNARDFYIEVSTDNALTWSQIWTVPGQTAGWVSAQLDLNAYEGMPNVCFRMVGVTGAPSKCTIALNRISIEDTKSAYNYLWSTGATTQSIVVEDSIKNYQVTLTDPNGCSVIDQVRLADGCLPLTMNYFKVTAADCKVRVFWETSMEENIAYFELERSLDGIEYKTVSRLTALGGNKTQGYEYIDQGIQGLYYYRLKIGENDGTYNYYEQQLAVKACFENRVNEITEIFPNPTSEKVVHLKLYSLQNQLLEIDIIDAYGRTVKSLSQEKERGEQTLDINIEALPVGVYFIKLSGNNWEAESKRFVRMLE